MGDGDHTAKTAIGGGTDTAQIVTFRFGNVGRGRMIFKGRHQWLSRYNAVMAGSGPMVRFVSDMIDVLIESNPRGMRLNCPNWPNRVETPEFS